MHEKMVLSTAKLGSGHIIVEDNRGVVTLYLALRDDYADLTPLEAINLAGLLTDAAYRSMNE